MRYSCIATAALIAAAAALPAHAATVCSVTDLSIQAQACAGFFDGNLLSNSPTDVAAQKAALNSLGFVWNGDFNTVEKHGVTAGTLDFSTPLNSTTYLAIHFGNGKGGPGNATAFYRLDAGSNLDSLLLNYSAGGNAVLYATSASTPPVPEPETYGMLLAGLGVVGFIARRRQR